MGFLGSVVEVGDITVELDATFEPTFELDPTFDFRPEIEFSPSIDFRPELAFEPSLSFNPSLEFAPIFAPSLELSNIFGVGIGNAVTDAFNYLTSLDHPHSSVIDNTGWVKYLHDDMIASMSSLGVFTGSPMGFFPIIGDAYAYGEGIEFQHRVYRAFQPNLLGPSDYIDAFHRALLSPEELEYYLTSLGYNLENREVMAGLSWYIPQAQDLILFAVREVYNPEIVETFRQNEGLDEVWENIKPDADAAHLSHETFQKYWAAHWSLPGIQQGFEMLHRDEITETELGKLLVALDIMPFWREPLTKIAYSPLTRVDVRRMYNAGVLSPEETKEAYKHLGYSPLNAQRMLEFTEQYYKTPERDLTKTEILRLYQERALDREGSAVLIAALGYSGDEVELLLTLEDLKTLQAYKKDTIETMKDGYVLGAYTVEQVEDALGKLDLGDIEVATTLNKFEQAKNKNIKLPTKSDLESWYSLGLIDADRFYIEMELLGYQMKYIDLYFKEMTA